MSGLPRGWVEVDLMEVINLHDSIRIPLNKSERSARIGTYPYYGANGLVDYIDDYLLDGEFVLLAEDGGNFDVPGKPVAYGVAGKFWVNNHAHILSAKDAIPVAFLLYWCNSWNWMPFVGGTTRLKLTQEGMRKVRFPLPPLAEQRRIVAKLEALNAKSARARTALARIETLVSRYKQAVLRKAFSGRKERFENYIISTFYGPRFSKLNYVSDGVPTIRTTDFRPDGSIDITDAPRVAVADQDLEKWSLEAGDLLVTRTGSIGKCAVYRASDRPALPSAYLIRVRLELSRINPMFAYYAIISPDGFEHLGIKTTAVTQPNINAEAIRSMPILSTPLDVQHEIVRRIESAFAKIDRLAAEAKRALALVGRLDEAVLAKAFRGELVPQDENDEPAATLLARIRAEREAAPKVTRGRKARS